MIENLMLAVSLTVSPGGLSVNGALAKIREARRAGDTSVAAVKVKGVNRVTSPVVFTAEDHDIDFTGEPGAMISGGVEIRGWKDAGGGVWEAPAPKTPAGDTMFFDQLWVNGRRAGCARLPSKGWLAMTAAAQSAAPAGAPAKYVETVSFGDPEVKRLADVPKEDYPYLEIGVICKWSYGLRTLGAYDASRNEMKMFTDYEWRPWKTWRTNDTLFAFFNVRSAFDEPGEWFLDMKAGKVRYRPLAGERPDSAEFVAPFSGDGVVVKFHADWRNGESVGDIRFSGVSFAHGAAKTTGNRPVQINQHQAAIDMDGLISLEGARNIVFDGCSISRTAGYGMRFHSACRSNRVVNCRIEDLGAGGIFMGADFKRGEKLTGITRKVLPPSRPDSVSFNVISNCVITRGGRYNPEGTGVCIAHCSDTAVVHNDIYDFYYTGVSIGWIWGFAGSVAQRNDIGFNRIWDLGKGVMSDMGGVYSLGTSFGTRVHDNVIHDVKSYSYGGWALYCDEGSEGIIEERNVCWNTTDGGFHQHYGTGCLIRNNIFAFNRMLGAVRMARKVVQGVPCTLHFVNNIVYGDSGPLVGAGVRGVGGVWANNLWYDARGVDRAEFDGLDWHGWTKCGKESGGAFADPRFVDAKNFDFRLKADSPAVKLGFVPFDYSGAGANLDR
ncbi:MAG: right-handed parallel beta-helix repeat-containing protein [Kiritimatiellae bacterium]|nr:right-handed parallel beta-helix repeat-containing protein [Kiritimatiellia bacterium]